MQHRYLLDVLVTHYSGHSTYIHITIKKILIIVSVIGTWSEIWMKGLINWTDPCV